jgi:hypothetical protein
MNNDQHTIQFYFISRIYVLEFASLIIELLTLSEHMSSLPVCSGVRVTRSLVLCVMLCRSLFVPLSFLFWPLCCLSFCLLVIVLSVLLSFGHCVVCPSVFWSLCRCSSVVWSLCCLFFCLLAIVLSVLLSFGHCVVCSSVFWPLCCLSFFGFYRFWLPLWYLQTLHNWMFKQRKKWVK